MKNCMIAIPAYNPGGELLEYVNDLIHFGFHSIVVVNDGSEKEYNPLFEELDKKQEVEVLHHSTNLGKGSALKNAIGYFLNAADSQRYKGLITVDSDGQHLVEDVMQVYEKLAASTKTIVLGTRNFDEKIVPFKSKLGNKATRKLFKILYGKDIVDTQTGLRGFSRETIPLFMNTSGDRYEYETNVLIEAVKNGIPLIEVPISTVYKDGNSESHFRPIVDSLKIYSLLFSNFIKYIWVSIGSFVIDVSLFQLFIILLGSFPADQRIFSATIFARVVSSLFNYLANKTFVFKSDKRLGSSALKYFVLVITQLVLSATLVYFLYSITGVDEAVIKVIVDTVLFFVNYHIQRLLIF